MKKFFRALALALAVVVAVPSVASTQVLAADSPESVSIEKATVANVTLAKKSVKYTGKTIEVGVTADVTVDGKKLVAGDDYTITAKTATKNVNKAAKVNVTITGIGKYTGKVTKTATIEIKKGAAKISAVSKKTLKAKDLKKKSKSFTGATTTLGTISAKKVSGSKNVTVSKAGKITVKKGTKKGSYSVKVKFAVKGTKNFTGKTVTKTIKVTVK